MRPLELLFVPLAHPVTTTTTITTPPTIDSPVILMELIAAAVGVSVVVILRW